MAKKFNKDFWKSRTVWGAAIVFVGAVLTSMGLTDYSHAIMGLGASLGLIGVRYAKK